MIEDMIERYFKFNTKICTYKLIFGNFNDETIPPNYYNLLNDDDGDGNNSPDTPVDDSLPDNEGVDYEFVTNDETSTMG